MDYAVYLLYRAVEAVLRVVPLRLVFLMGRMLGAIAFRVAPGYRGLVLRNMRIALGNEKTEGEIRGLARRHFAMLGANLLSSLKVSVMKPEEIRKIVTVENQDLILERALNRKQGFVFVISHMGNWELFAQVMPLLYNCPLGTVFQRLGNRHIDAHVRSARSRQGLALFERKEGFNGAMQMLRQPGGVGVLVDQHAGDAGTWVPLFGRLASTSPLAATLALRTRSCLLPTALYTDGVAHWRMVICEPISFTTRDPVKLTAEINLALEKQIRRSPEDWFWVHNRWKTPHPDFLLARYKRGVCLPGNMTERELKPFRILIRSSNWLGDAIMTIPAVQAIKAGRPDSRITLLTPAKLSDLWKLVPAVDEVVAIERGTSVFAAAKQAGPGFDVAIIFPNSVRSAIEVFLTRTPRRVGYAGKWRKALLNQIVPEREKPGPPEHQVHHYLRLAESIGAVTTDWEAAWNQFRPPVPAPTPGARLRIGLCPGADYGPAKRWLPERFASVAERVMETVDCEWTLFGVENDAHIGGEITRALGGRCVNLIGKTTLAQLIESLAGCRALLTNDTGTMHLGAFLRVPTVAIFGSTEPALTGPLGAGHRIIRHHVECSPCFLRECPIDFRCMDSVSAEEVAGAVLSMLSRQD
jgi:heptosyltransferase-2